MTWSGSDRRSVQELATAVGLTLLDGEVEQVSVALNGLFRLGRDLLEVPVDEVLSTLRFRPAWEE